MEYYCIVLVFLIIIFFYYLSFCSTINDYLRNKKVSKTRIKKLKHGFFNFWWYEEINNVQPLGWIYYINKIFTILFIFVLVIHIIFGWIKILAFPILILCIIADLVASVMSIFGRIQHNLTHHNVRFVLIAKNPYRGTDSIFFDILFFLISLFLAYCQYKAI